MTSEIIYDTIKRTVLSYLPDSRILLFGSRARGESDIHSDYDLLVITPNALTRKEKLGWSAQIDRAIVKAIHAPIDLLLYSENEYPGKTAVAWAYSTFCYEGGSSLMTPEMKTFIEAWLKKAEGDIITAQRVLEIEPMILDIACFHCQQAVEKSLKAFIAYNGRDIVKTHSITYLLSECSDFDPIFCSIDPLNLNEYAVRSRYPDDSIMPDADEARGLYQLAIQINSMVKERIIFAD